MQETRTKKENARLAIRVLVDALGQNENSASFQDDIFNAMEYLKNIKFPKVD